MVTLNEQLIKYCEINQIYYPSKNLRQEIGRYVSAHFKRKWGLSQPKEIIDSAGFILSEEDGKKMIVIGYPDSFADEMLVKIDEIHLLKKKSQEKPDTSKEPKEEAQQLPPIPPTKKRTRKPVGKTPEKSVKPSERIQ